MDQYVIVNLKSMHQVEPLGHHRRLGRNSLFGVFDLLNCTHLMFGVFSPFETFLKLAAFFNTVSGPIIALEARCVVGKLWGAAEKVRK